MSGGILGILSLLVGSGCVFLARSDWFDNRLRQKWDADKEDLEDRVQKQKRDWTWIGIFWIVFGMLQVLMAGA